MASYTNEEITIAVEKLQGELRELLSPEDAAALAAALAEAVDRFRCVSESDYLADLAVVQTLRAVRAYEPAQERLRQILVAEFGVRDDTRLEISTTKGPGYQSSPGSPQEVPQVGDPAVCPEDREHHQDTLRILGERCPVCNAELIKDTSQP